MRLPPKSNFEVMLARAAQIGAVVTGLVATIFALDAGEYVLAPVATAVVIGLMLSPLATALERRGLPAGVSATMVVLLFIGLLTAFVAAIATPLTAWADRLPQIWQDLQFQLSNFKQPIETLNGLRDQIRDVTGGSGMTVSVEEASTMESVATLAPALLGQILLFFASLYFFVATRNQTRLSVLRLCVGRRLRWRVAHIFRDVERSVSRYLLSIAIINIGLGIAVAIVMFAIGMPSAALWGALAGLMNFVVYIGPAIMAALFFLVGLAEFDSIGGALLPPLLYLTVNMIEAQFVTPYVVGRTLTLNPFVVILALAFWIWMWGPLGGFIAIPAVLICYAILANILPIDDRMPGPPAGRLP